MEKKKGKNRKFLGLNRPIVIMGRTDERRKANFRWKEKIPSTCRLTKDSACQKEIKHSGGVNNGLRHFYYHEYV